MMKKIVSAILLIVVVLIGIGYYIFREKFAIPKSEINSFEECAAAGYTVMESYPRQCRTPEGVTFVEKIPDNVPVIIPGARSILHEDKEFGFRFWYPEGSNVRKENFEGYLKATQNGVTVAAIFLDESLFKGTNLSEAAVVVGVSPDKGALANCERAVDNQEIERGTADIRGATFHLFEATGVGAGNIYESKIYRTIMDGSCYEIVELLHSGNIGNYPQDTVKEFDKAKFTGILENIVHTFVFIK